MLLWVIYLHSPGGVYGLRENSCWMAYARGLEQEKVYQFGMTAGYRVQQKTRYKITNRNEEVRLVSDLINKESRTWNTELIVRTFNTDIMKKIMQIQVWRGEATRVFTVRSAYKLLQESTTDLNDYLQTHTNNFFRKLWNLDMPTKIKITVWKIAWNYIPTFSSLKLRRVITEDRCLRCGQETEDSNHVFQQCPIAKEVWGQLNYSWVFNNSNLDLWSWLTWVFSKGTTEQCRGFSYGLWILWTSRNKFLYEGKISTSRDISKQIKSYILEMEGIRNRELTSVTNTKSSQRQQRENMAIFFDAAFDSQHNRSASGLVVKEEGKIVAAKLILHENVASPFAAEAWSGETLRELWEEQEPTRLDHSEQRERR
ncbi:uncharacterized protein [Gossypium hirsutum]|uniref:Reverse transcriptase zinc-binding domain-containing protein n=1 Tax=Gossypium hirsutum TaxID=3635 RepID=A0ABM3BFN2_GOSHI|nr:uncharacterized protein LOC107919457 [Gossypium hirsutum]